MQRVSYAVENVCRSMAVESQLKKHAKSRDKAYRLKKFRETPTEEIMSELMKDLKLEGKK